MRFYSFLFFAALYLAAPARAQADTAAPVWGDWKTWGDRGDGTYANPVLPSDYSDPDCICVGDDYYAISSTFQYSPGMVILHSTDLVNWRILGHVVTDLNQISPEMNWDRMNRYGRGIWAGAIRYHDKKFWVYFGTPDEGYFMSTAVNPEGPWEALTPVLKEKGWDDCCPFWDDDGQGYLIGSRFSDGYKIHLWKMTPDGKGLVKESDVVLYQSKGSEANKLYKIKDTYYHLFSEVKSDGRALMMERSKNILGPYEGAKQLSRSQKAYREPNQGGLVQTQKGAWYFLTHHGTGDWSGRILSLLPVSWVDGWPVIGKVESDSIGIMVWQGKMPLRATVRESIQTNDEFNGPLLQNNWEWNYQPRARWWSLNERKGWLRLSAFPPLEQGNLLKAGNTLTQRVMRTQANEAIVKLDVSGMADGQEAGLSHFGSPGYSALGIVCNGTVKRLSYNLKGKLKTGPELNGNLLWLKTTWGLDGISRYWYSVDGKTFEPFGEPYSLAWGSYRGDRLAVYCYNNKEAKGYVDIDFFHYKYSQ